MPQGSALERGVLPKTIPFHCCCGAAVGRLALRGSEAQLLPTLCLGLPLASPGSSLRAQALSSGIEPALW